MMRRQLERYGRWLVVIGVLVVCAGISGAYIMQQQRVVTPLASRYTVKAEFENTSGLEPGLGQPVDVAGVRVGSITKADLRDGRSVVSLQIDPGDLPHVFADARATLVPNTPLDDMQVELDPGTAKAGKLADDAVIGAARTVSPLNLDEFLAALDGDTRTYFQALMGSADTGTRGRGRDLRALLRTLRPTAQQLHEVTGALASRHRELRSAVHNLALVTHATAGKDRELADVVDRAAATVGAVASQERALGESVDRLPGTLAAARRVIGDRAVVDKLGVTLDDLLPVARRLPSALRAAGPLAKKATPLVRDQVRPLTLQAQPLARYLAPTVRNLNAVTPHLDDAFSALNQLGNELGFNPPGSEEGYLFWLAWFAHNLNSQFSTSDANGAVLRGYSIVSCDSLREQPPDAQTIVAALAPIPACD